MATPILMARSEQVGGKPDLNHLVRAGSGSEEWGAELVVLARPEYDHGMTSADAKGSTVGKRRASTRRAKVAVTLPQPLLARARERVRSRETPSLSALVAQALEEKLERDYLQEVLDEMAAAYGPLTPEELAWADRILEG